jgi:NAD-dependent SIR2 family protein deacetylase
MEEAEYILLGCVAGLSAAAGITYSGKRFRGNFVPYDRSLALSHTE